MLRLGDWMRKAGLSDDDVAAQAGISAEMVRKMRFGARGASVRVAACIDTLSGGQVRPAALVAAKSRPRRAPSLARKVRP